MNSHYEKGCDAPPDTCQLLQIRREVQLRDKQRERGEGEHDQMEGREHAVASADISKMQGR